MFIRTPIPNELARSFRAWAFTEWWAAEHDENLLTVLMMGA